MTKEQVETAVKQKGFIWFDGVKDYDLNIIGIRNSIPNDKVTNKFDDTITVSYKLKGKWKFHLWKCTTDPGRLGVIKFRNKEGVARLVEGQYRGSYTIGLHQGKYEALTQMKPVRVYRDNNRDMKYDESRIKSGIFGINIHKAGEDSTNVENWSEGCQVFKKSADFDSFMAIVKKSAKIHGPIFTYTLIESSDIK
jgi:hypothetical protein